MKVVVIEPLGVSAEQFAKETSRLKQDGHEFVVADSRFSEQDKLIEFASGADILIVANQPLPGDVVRACSKLKMISVAFTGIDHIPMDVCREKNIAVCNAAGYSTASVAELAIGLILAVYRNIPQGDTACRNSGTKHGLGTELFGKTVGIVGAGAIATHTAKVLLAFGCKVLVWSRTKKQNLIDLGCEWRDSLEALLPEVDIISLHVPGGATTKALIGEPQLKLMKKTAILINTARGSVVDTASLAKALNEGVIAGAGLDVFDREPPLPQDEPLLTAKNTVVAPHVAFATTAALERRLTIVINNIAGYLSGNLQNVC